jgi:tetratricopeptide (TPR) repeat protein
MPEDQEKNKDTLDYINKCLDEGLVFYGLGDFKKAVEKWREILKIAPDNAQARDYILSAGFPIEEEENKLNEIKKLINEKKFEESYELAKLLCHEKPEDEEAKKLFNISRESLMEKFTRIFKNTGVIPFLKIEMTELMNYSLTQEDGFIISLIDGKSTLQEVIDASGLNDFDCKRILSRLLELKIIGFKN